MAEETAESFRDFLKGVLEEQKDERLPSIALLGEPMEDVWHFGWFKGKLSQVNPDVRVFQSDVEIVCDGGAESVSKSLGLFFRRNHLGWDVEISKRERCFDLHCGKVVARTDVDFSAVLKEGNLERIGKCSGLVIADYGRGMISPGLLKSIAALYPDLPVVCSPHVNTCAKMPEDFNIEDRNWTWVMNQAECEALPFERETFKSYVVTNGVCRTDIFSGGIGHDIGCLEKVDALHTVGIGDVFLSAFCAAYFRKKPLDFCVRFAQAMASQVLKARRFETCRITRDDINTLYKADSSEGVGSGVVADQPA